MPPGADRLRLNLPSLPIASRVIATSRAARAAAATLIIEDLPADRDRVDAAIEAFDVAVRDVLHAAGLPRGAHVKGPVLTSAGQGWAGRKAPDCRIFIDRETFRDLPGEERPDSLFRTWLHESMHGRRPYSTGFAAEWRAYRGFEEGMVEGLTRELVVDGLGLQPVLASYSYFVEAYRALSIALDVPVRDLWLPLWELPAGDLGHDFVPALESVLGRHERPALTPRQRTTMFARAHTVFASSNSTLRPDAMMLVNLWREVLR